jgi:hypothetical protein
MKVKAKKPFTYGGKHYSPKFGVVEMSDKVALELLAFGTYIVKDESADAMPSLAKVTVRKAEPTVLEKLGK